MTMEERNAFHPEITTKNVGDLQLSNYIRNV